MTSAQVHLASARIRVAAHDALEFLRAPEKLCLWAVGLADQRVVEPDLVAGVLGASRETCYCRIDAAPRQHTIVYRLGASLVALAPRIMIQVMPGESIGRDGAECVVSMLAWRTADMSDIRWRALQSAHEQEILQIRSLLETQNGAKQPDS